MALCTSGNISTIGSSEKQEADEDAEEIFTYLYKKLTVFIYQ